MLFIFVYLLRNLRKHHSFLHIICRTSAIIIQFCALFAELPQIGCKFRLTYLEAFTTSKNFRKAKTGMEKAPLLSFFSYFCMQKIKNSNEITMNILELSEQEIVRRQCLQELKEMGINPYPAAEFPTNAFSVDIKKAFDADEEKREVVIAGRMMSRRIMGKASFMELQDSRGRIQVYISRDDICPGDDKDLYNKVFKKLLDIGDFVGVKGFVFRTQTGEVSVHAQ